ncbi:transposase [Streptomyces sp. NPDC127112]|uniref:transposase n=1 Tax=Streptomyces sp. NPDC127112 TaxID=3345364 RepID=UPI0036403C5C
MAGADGYSLAGSASTVRASADRLRTLPPPAARRHLAAVAGQAPSASGRRSPICRAHQHSAGARRDGEAQKEPPGGTRTEPDDHGLGRSRGGFTTKIHLACEQGQRPLSVLVTAGQRGDSPQFTAVLEGIRVPRIGPGRPRIRPLRVRGDKAYSSQANRPYLRKPGIRCTTRSLPARRAIAIDAGRPAGGSRPSTARTTRGIAEVSPEGAMG